MTRVNVSVKFLLRVSHREPSARTHLARLSEQTPSIVVKCLHITFTGTVTNLYTALTLVLQILYCLGSPSHGPPTGFLQLRDEILWHVFLLQMERDVAKVWKKELLQTLVYVLMLTHATTYTSEIINTHKHLQKRVHNSTRVIMYVSDKNIM